MEKISKIINNAELEIRRQEKKTEKPINPVVAEIVNRLFVLFFGICRGFEKQYADPKRLNIEKTQWMKAFEDLKIYSFKKIRFGIKRCRLESPINTPTIKDFMLWCTPAPEDIGLPSVHSAYIEACENSHFAANKKWTHKVIMHAWKATGSRELTTLSKVASFPIFSRNFDIAVRMFINGEPMDDIPKAIEGKKENHFNGITDKGRSHLSALKGMLR